MIQDRAIKKFRESHPNSKIVCIYHTAGYTKIFIDFKAGKKIFTYEYSEIGGVLK